MKYTFSIHYNQKQTANVRWLTGWDFTIEITYRQQSLNTYLTHERSRTTLYPLTHTRDHLATELGYILLDTFAYTFLKLIFEGHNDFKKFQTHQNMLKPRVKASALQIGREKCHFLLQTLRFLKSIWYNRVYNPALNIINVEMMQ